MKTDQGAGPSAPVSGEAGACREDFWGSAVDRGDDPEFAALFSRFAAETAAFGGLDSRTHFTVVLAALLGCGGREGFSGLLPAALDGGVTPEVVKEILYQGTAYCGFGRVAPFLADVNALLRARGTALPLPGAATTTAETRLDAGIQAQVDIFGEGMRDFTRSGPEETRHINRWLAENCFGDYYTRRGLDYRERELITFCFLASLGGCEPQLTSHAAANLRVGNSKEFLIAVLSHCLPYVGYPRTLNALRCLDNAAAAGKQG